MIISYELEIFNEELNMTYILRDFHEFLDKESLISLQEKLKSMYDNGIRYVSDSDIKEILNENKSTI